MGVWGLGVNFNRLFLDSLALPAVRGPAPASHGLVVVFGWCLFISLPGHFVSFLFNPMLSVASFFSRLAGCV